MNSKRFLLTIFGIAAISLSLLFFSACESKRESSTPERDSLALTYAVRTQWPHDIQAFTQGLVIHEGKLYESTGQKGTSWIGIVDINTGVADKKVNLPQAYFGEGITILNKKIYQLTWQSHVGFVYDLSTYEKLREFEYPGEGWGITHDNNHLIMSDGTDKLTYLDTTSLKPVKTLSVTDERGPVKDLNELEYIEGYIFANLWQTNVIVKIDPSTGRVVGRMDLSELAADAQRRSPRVDVLNGIAYHPTTKMVLVTGKYWPMIYVLQVR